MVANPPYGNKGNLVLATDIAIDTGKYSTNMQDFFINQSAKVLSQTGFMAFVVPSSFMDQEKSPSKEFLIDSGVAFKQDYDCPLAPLEAQEQALGLIFFCSKKNTRSKTANKNTEQPNTQIVILGIFSEMLLMRYWIAWKQNPPNLFFFHF